MMAACTGWEPIHGFRSPGEFERFRRWLDERLAEGTAEPVRVDPDWKDANPLFEQWFRCRQTGEVWRLLEPDPPSRGAFDRLKP